MVQMNFKTKRYENPEYLAFIRTKECIVCGGDSMAHHYISVAAGGSDLFTLPLCADHHTLGGDSIHRLGKKSFPEHHRLDVWEEMARLLAEFMEAPPRDDNT
jgi:hypothetical protein